MKRMKSVLAMLLALLMVLSLAACGGDKKADEPAADAPAADAPAADAPAADAPAADAPAADAPAADPAKKLDVLNLGVYGDDTYTGTFDPCGAWAGTGAGYGVLFCLYDTPFYIGSDGKYTSRIVEEFEWTDDTTMVMKIKDGIMFSNGVQLTGNDILYSLDLIANHGGMRSGYYKPFDVANSTVSEDGLTITLKTFEPYAAYYGGLDFPIVCKEYLESQGGGENIDWYDPNAVVGSGPYTCTEFTSGAFASYTKREGYWGLEHGYDDIYNTINVTKYTDASTMCIDLETGALDLAVGISIQDYDRLTPETGDTIETALIDGGVVYQLVFDSNYNEALKDPKVREALCCAVDTEALTAAVAGAYGETAQSMFAKNEIGFIGGCSYEYDPEKAKALLAEAGYSDLSLVFSFIGQDPYTQMAEIIQGYFAEVGVTMTVNSLEFAAFIANSKTPGFTDIQIYTMKGGNPTGEPVVHLDNWYSDSTSPVMKRTPEYDALMIAGETSLDMAAREEAYAALQKLWYENFDGVPLYEFKTGYAYNSEVFAEVPIASASVLWLFDAVLK